MNFQIKKNVPYIYTLLVLIYIFQRNFPLLKTLAVFSAITAILISIFYTFKYLIIEHRKNLFPSSLLLFFAYYCFEYFNSSLPDYAIQMLKDFMVVNLTFFPFYFFAKRKMIKDNFFKNIFFILIVLYIYDYFNSFTRILIESSGQEVLGELVNNSGYYFVSLLPFLFFIRNTNIKMALFLFICAFVLYSAKRGAIVTLLLGGLLLLPHMIYSVKQSNYKFFNIFVFVLLVVTGFYYLNQFFVDNTMVTERFILMFEGDSSTRDELYVECWDTFWNTNNLFVYILGYGLGGTVYILGSMAHNDWLQIVFDTGIIGLFLMLIYSIGLLFLWYNEKRIIFKGVILICSYLLLFRTFFTMSFIDYSSFPLIMILGYILGKEKSNMERKIR